MLFNCIYFYTVTVELVVTVIVVKYINFTAWQICSCIFVFIIKEIHGKRNMKYKKIMIEEFFDRSRNKSHRLILYENNIVKNEVKKWVENDIHMM